jgi:hypothetical protein
MDMMPTAPQGAPQQAPQAPQAPQMQRGGVPTNPYQLTSQVAKAPDQQLTQMLQQYKGVGDAVSFSVVYNELQRRKEMRGASQAQQAPAQQPTVADQALTGIAAAPAGDMQFADGGIVGFATGNMVGPYQRSGLSLQETSELERLAQMRNDLSTPYFGSIHGRDQSQAREAQLGQIDPRFNELLGKNAAARQAEQDARFAQMFPEEAAPQPQAPAQPQAAAPAPAEAPRREFGDVGYPSTAFMRDKPPMKSPAEEVESLNMEGIMRLLAPEAGTKGFEAIMKSADAAKADDLKALEAYQKQRRDPTKAIEDIIAKGEASEVEDRRDAKRQALIMAGAAIANSTGPLGAAIGQGAMAALPGYKQDMRAIKKAEDERDKLRILADQAHQAMLEGDYKAHREITKEHRALSTTVALEMQKAEEARARTLARTGATVVAAQITADAAKSQIEQKADDKRRGTPSQLEEVQRTQLAKIDAELAKVQVAAAQGMALTPEQEAAMAQLMEQRRGLVLGLSQLESARMSGQSVGAAPYNFSLSTGLTSGAPQQ